MVPVISDYGEVVVAFVLLFDGESLSCAVFLRPFDSRLHFRGLKIQIRAAK